MVDSGEDLSDETSVGVVLLRNKSVASPAVNLLLGGNSRFRFGDVLEKKMMNMIRDKWDSIFGNGKLIQFC